jgi:hypothetical protein
MRLKNWWLTLKERLHIVRYVSGNVQGGFIKPLKEKYGK